MGRQNSDVVVLCSSIALLQERFKRLQRIKEMREERQILRLLAEAEQPTSWFFHNDLIHPSGLLHGSPSLQIEYHVNCAEFQSIETMLSLGLWSNVNMHASKMSNETEVDTSLHL